MDHITRSRRFCSCFAKPQMGCMGQPDPRRKSLPVLKQTSLKQEKSFCGQKVCKTWGSKHFLLLICWRCLKFSAPFNAEKAQIHCHLRLASAANQHPGCTKVVLLSEQRVKQGLQLTVHGSGPHSCDAHLQGSQSCWLRCWLSRRKI